MRARAATRSPSVVTQSDRYHSDSAPTKARVVLAPLCTPKRCVCKEDSCSRIEVRRRSRAFCHSAHPTLYRGSQPQQLEDCDHHVTARSSGPRDEEHAPSSASSSLPYASPGHASGARTALSRRRLPRGYNTFTPPASPHAFRPKLPGPALPPPPPPIPFDPDFPLSLATPRVSTRR